MELPGLTLILLAVIFVLGGDVTGAKPVVKYVKISLPSLDDGQVKDLDKPQPIFSTSGLSDDPSVNQKSPELLVRSKRWSHSSYRRGSRPWFRKPPRYRHAYRPPTYRPEKPETSQIYKPFSRAEKPGRPFYMKRLIHHTFTSPTNNRRRYIFGVFIFKNHSGEHDVDKKLTTTSKPGVDDQKLTTTDRPFFHKPDHHKPGDHHPSKLWKFWDMIKPLFGHHHEPFHRPSSSWWDRPFPSLLGRYFDHLHRPTLPIFKPSKQDWSDYTERFVYKYAVYIPLVYRPDKYTFTKPANMPDPSRFLLARLKATCRKYPKLCDEAMKHRTATDKDPEKPSEKPGQLPEIIQKPPKPTKKPFKSLEEANTTVNVTYTTDKTTFTSESMTSIESMTTEVSRNTSLLLPPPDGSGEVVPDLVLLPEQSDKTEIGIGWEPEIPTPQ